MHQVSLSLVSINSMFEIGSWLLGFGKAWKVGLRIMKVKVGRLMKPLLGVQEQDTKR